MFAINVQYPIFVAVLETYEHIKTYKHTNIWTLRYVWGGQSMAGGRALKQEVMGMLCVTSQSDVFCWGLQGFNYLNCLALYFSVKGETCMR